jgi:tRNA dimethylallyltransferase
MLQKTKNSPLIVIVGPTASGKSALALILAQKFGGEIICADSRTVYKGMDIGTAKPSRDEQKLVRHHLLDIREPNERFTAADFQQLANQAIDDISTRGRIPILVGGTGLYIDAVIYNYGFSSGDVKRNSLNPRHLSHDTPVHKEGLRSDALVIGINLDKEELRERVTKRVDQMIQDGLLEEVKRLVDQYGITPAAFLTTSYKPFIEHLNGTLSINEAKALFIKNDMNLAKRQMTWFKRNKSIRWVDNPRDAVDIATTFLNKTIR